MTPENANSSPTNAQTPPARATGPDDCWNRNGVHGDRSCPELPKIVHCRNCPSYSEGALELLAEPLPSGYREEWSARVAIARKDRQLPTSSVILFRLRSQWLALPTRCFQEVADSRPVHSLPFQAPFILGLANIRGELTVCISLACFLGLPAERDPGNSSDSRGRLLVVKWNELRFCFAAHEVQGPVRLTQGEMSSGTTPNGGQSQITHGVLHLEKGPVGLLDANLLCSALSRKLK